MQSLVHFLGSTIGKKILMAITGFILASFVLVHMLGNLQFFISPEAINIYAHHLQSLPSPILWGFRLVIFLSVVIHATMALMLSKEKADARPEPYEVQKSLQATYASRTMMMGGIILFCFIVFHLLHFTIKTLPAPYEPGSFIVTQEGATFNIPNVYEMMVHGFKNVWVSLFYILGTGMLCLHLSHGVSSMFQTVGLRNETWRRPLNVLAFIYGWGVFLGFVVLPVSVLTGWKA